MQVAGKKSQFRPSSLDVLIVGKIFLVQLFWKELFAIAFRRQRIALWWASLVDRGVVLPLGFDRCELLFLT